MPKHSKFEVKLNDSSWKDRLTQLRLSSCIDRYARLEIFFAFDTKQLHELSLDDYPQTAQLTWANQIQFEGTLSSARVIEGTQISLEFVDRLYILEKIHKNDTLKPQSLRSALTALTRDTGISPHFRGDFSTEIPGFNLSGQSIYRHLQELSNKCGFQFHYRPAEKRLELTKIGSHIDKIRIDCKSHKIADIGLIQSANEGIEELSYSYFDASDMEKKENRLTSEQLYGAISSSGTLFKEKLKWECSKGKKQAVLTDKQQFESAPSIFASQYSKRLVKQEKLKLVGLTPMGLPGDQLEISKMPAPRLGDGNYCVSRCEILIKGCQPQTTVVATRA